jgi:hypothetical protein
MMMRVRVMMRVIALMMRESNSLDDESTSNDESVSDCERAQRIKGLSTWRAKTKLVVRGISCVVLNLGNRHG